MNVISLLIVQCLRVCLLKPSCAVARIVCVRTLNLQSATGQLFDKCKVNIA